MFLLGAFIGPIIEPMHERTVKKLAASGALLLVGGVATMVGTLGAEAHAVCAGLAAFATAWCAMNPTPRYTGYIRGGLPVYEDGSGPAG
ncbi:MAG TPA: hypothetical protein VLC93_07930, partial [Myxococcota bacterium]|nr:hypothetical protein [Myxococcota bacterium]